jgi:hypothetical protein
MRVKKLVPHFLFRWGSADAVGVYRWFESDWQPFAVIAPNADSGEYWRALRRFDLAIASAYRRYFSRGGSRPCCLAFSIFSASSAFASLKTVASRPWN